MRNNASHYTRHGPGADADLAGRARKRFTSVNLTVSDVTFAGLGRVDATKLVGLNLAFCHEIDDHALAVVGQFALLEQLDLSACRSITGASMGDLRGRVPGGVTRMRRGADAIDDEVAVAVVQRLNQRSVHVRDGVARLDVSARFENLVRRRSQPDSRLGAPIQRRRACPHGIAAVAAE